MTIINDNILDYENLNNGIGAEFVQKSKQIPRNFHDTWMAINKETGATPWGTSYDGDADRIVFYTYNGNAAIKEMKLIDGDRISVLYANAVGRFLPI